MSDLLNVTTPISPKTYDMTNTREAPQTQTNPNFNLSDTTKIIQTNDRSDEYANRDTKDGSSVGSLGITSSAAKNPTAASGMLRSIIGTEAMRTLSSSGNAAALNKVTEFANEVMLKPTELASDMIKQESDSTVYSGGLWNEMKNMLATGNEVDAEAVVSFAKAAADASARDGVLDSVSAGLRYLASETAQSGSVAKELNTLADNLSNDNFTQLKGNVLNVLDMLKNSLLLDDSTKNLISLITYNLSRYNPNTSNLGESFNAVLDLAKSPEQAQNLRQLFMEYIDNSQLPDDMKLEALKIIESGGDSPASALTVLSEKIGAAMNAGSAKIAPDTLETLLNGINGGGTDAIRDALSLVIESSAMKGALGNVLKSYDQTGNVQSLVDRLSIMINSVDNPENKQLIADKINTVLSDFNPVGVQLSADSIIANQSAALLSQQIGLALDANLGGISKENLSKALSGFDTSQGVSSLRSVLSELLPSGAKENLNTLLRGFNSDGNLNRLIDDLGIMLNSVKDQDKKIILAQSLNQILGDIAESKGINYKPPSSMSNLFDFLTKNLNDPSLKSLSSMSRSEIVQGLLSAPSVYTPLLHYLVPINDKGTKAFGELWADPDAEQKNGSIDAKHLFLCFDIEDTGYFELELSTQDKSLQVQLLCPVGTEKQFAPLKESIPQLAAANGYEASKTNIGAVVKKRDLSQVFPKLRDKRSGLDVKI